MPKCTLSFRFGCRVSHLKAIVTGANQKSNRTLVMSFTEEDTEPLREMGLLAVVPTESDCTSRS